MEAYKYILEKSKQYNDLVIGLRREFHMYPELSKKEYKTTEKIASYLKEFGVDSIRVGCPDDENTGVIADILVDGANATVALRADIDALPIEEVADREYRSKHEGIMHACGHDAHVAMLLGAAKLLVELKEKGFLKNNVRLLFQPGEEIAWGAEQLIRAGALDGVDIIFGIHVWQQLEAGKIGIRSGPVMASADEFHIYVKGKGGHGAMPNFSVDPVVVSSYLVAALQTIVSREVNPLEPAVVTVGTINAGTAFNIIPEEAVMKGTVRCFNPQIRSFIENRIKQITSSVVSGMRATATVEYIPHLPSTINDKRATEFGLDVAEKLFGKDKVISEELQPTLGAEDFSLYLQKIPGAFAMLGTGNPDKGITAPHHHPSFNIDEDVLWMGVAWYGGLTCSFKKS